MAPHKTVPRTTVSDRHINKTCYLQHVELVYVVSFLVHNCHMCHYEGECVTLGLCHQCALCHHCTSLPVHSSPFSKHHMVHSSLSKHNMVHSSFLSKDNMVHSSSLSKNNMVHSSSLSKHLNSLLLDYKPNRFLRSAEEHLLVVSRTKLSSTSQAFSVAAPKLWNNLPLDIRNYKTI